jgi:hypothetical protein
MDEIKESIKVSMRQAKSWTQMSLRLSEANLQKADLPKHVQELTQAARRAMAGDPAAVMEYRKALNRSMAQVNRLARAGAPTRSLKAAYQGVIKATTKGSEAAIQKAVDVAVREKMRYNADRLARDQMTKAHIQAEYSEVLDDPQVIGMGYDLNAGHPRTDICDLHTKANLHGMGPGRHPLNHLPPFPFHIGCICIPYKVYEGTPKPSDDKQAEKFIKSRSVADQKHMLGVDGQKAFKRSPRTWKKNLKHYEAEKSINQLRQIKIKT